MSNQRLLFSQPEVRRMNSVATASGYARRLVDLETKRSGTPTKTAIKSVARRLHEPPGTLWGLLFRAPKRISADVLNALEAAVAQEIRREIGALEHELATLKTGAGRLDSGTMAEVEAGLARLRSTLSRNPS